MTRERLMTALLRMKQLVSMSGEALRTTCGRRGRDRRIAVSFETANAAAVPVTVLG